MAKTKSEVQTIHADEVAKLNDLAAQLAEKQTEIREALDRQNRNSGQSVAVDDAASALLGGTATAVKSVKVLSFERDALQQAVTRQTAIVDAARREVAKEISLAMVDEHRRIVADVVEAGRAFIEAHSKIQAFRSRYAQAAGGAFESPLLELDLQPALLTRFKNDITVFSDFVSQYSGR